MSDTEKDLAVHVAVCDERYRNIEASLKSGAGFTNLSGINIQ
jgi:hypothetical protein